MVKGDTRMTNAKEVLEYMAFKEERERNLTNEEWIRQCNTEQLAEEIYNFVWCSNELWQRLD